LRIFKIHAFKRGYVNKENIDKVMPYTDIFLYDIKAIDDDVHIKCTGESNKLILENLKYIDSMGKDIEIRIPCVPDYNDSQIEKIFGFLKDFKNIKSVKTLPYHNFAGSKYEALGSRRRFELSAVFVANSTQYFVKMLVNTDGINCAFSLSCFEFIAKTSSNSSSAKKCRFLVRKAKMG